MKKTTLYRQASWIADSMLSNMEYRIKSLEEMEEMDEDDTAQLVCYKVIQEYFSNMEFLKSIRV